MMIDIFFEEDKGISALIAEVLPRVIRMAA
jgi:hypothetical protein